MAMKSRYYAYYTYIAVGTGADGEVVWVKLSNGVVRSGHVLARATVVTEVVPAPVHHVHA